MKNPLKTHIDHQNRLDEIFGKISNFFQSLKQSISPESDRDILYKANLVKGQLKLLDPSTCSTNVSFYDPKEPYYFEKGKGKGKGKEKNRRYYKPSKLPKSGRIKILPNNGIMIDDDKIILNYADLYVENLVRESGMGTFRKLNVRDLVCYDLSRDIYGIAWLLDPYASYTAEKISGKLLANKYNQSVLFQGNWESGKFYGRAEGSRQINKILNQNKNSSINKAEVQKKLENLQNLVKQTKINFDTKFKNEDFDNIEKTVKNSKNNQLIKFIPELYTIKNYLSTIESKKGMGTSTYIKSDEVYNLKSRIDKNEDLDDISSDIDDLLKYFKTIDSKINNFYKEYNKLSTPTTPPTTPPISGIRV
jgi:hypothetical protein